MKASVRQIRALWLLGGAVAFVLFVQTWIRADRPGGIDLTSYLDAAREVQRGGNPYALTGSYPYIYPLFFAFALIPLAHLPAKAALLLWFVIAVAALLWTTRTLLRTAYPELEALTVTPFMAVLFVVAYPVIQSNLRNGQANLVVLALCVATFVAYRDGRDGRGAMAWATAIAIKIVPVMVAPFFLRRSRWALSTAALFVAAVWCTLPVMTMGGEAFRLSRQYIGSFVAGSFSVSQGTDPLDFSAGAMLVRTIRDVPTLWLRLTGALVPLAMAVAADYRTRLSARADPCAFALYLALIPLVSPKSEVHHLVFALPAAAVTFGSIWYGFVSRRGAVARLLAVAALAYLAAVTIRTIADVSFFLSLSALASATFVLLRRTARLDADLPLHT